MQNTYMRQIPPDELRFRIKLAVQKIPASTTQRLHRSGRDQRDLAVEEITQVIADELARYQVFGPDPIQPHGWPLA